MTKLIEEDVTENDAFLQSICLDCCFIMQVLSVDLL
jgi:hypothetical protein